MHDYYQILNIPHSAALPEIKLAYHSLLLKHHPDKNILSKHHHNHVQSSHKSSPDGTNHTNTNDKPINISLLKEAFTALSSPLARSRYDISLKKSQQAKCGPRPAQIISLEEFTQAPKEDGDQVWEYPCRCSGSYCITELDMDQGQHLVGCMNCSEVIWVGYQVYEDGDEDNDN